MFLDPRTARPTNIVLARAPLLRETALGNTLTLGGSRRTPPWPVASGRRRESPSRASSAFRIEEHAECSRSRRGSARGVARAAPVGQDLWGVSVPTDVRRQCPRPAAPGSVGVISHGNLVMMIGTSDWSDVRIATIAFRADRPRGDRDRPGTRRRWGALGATPPAEARDRARGHRRSGSLRGRRRHSGHRLVWTFGVVMRGGGDGSREGSAPASGRGRRGGRIGRGTSGSRLPLESPATGKRWWMPGRGKLLSPFRDTTTSLERRDRRRRSHPLTSTGICPSLRPDRCGVMQSG